MDENPPREWLTVEEVSARLKVHPETVRRWCWSNEISFMKLGNTVRIHASALTPPEGESHDRG